MFGKNVDRSFSKLMEKQQGNLSTNPSLVVCNQLMLIWHVFGYVEGPVIMGLLDDVRCISEMAVGKECPCKFFSVDCSCMHLRQ